MVSAVKWMIARELSARFYRLSAPSFKSGADATAQFQAVSSVSGFVKQ
jgi:hypothetical protein